MKERVYYLKKRSEKKCHNREKENKRKDTARLKRVTKKKKTREEVLERETMTTMMNSIVIHFFCFSFGFGLLWIEDASTQEPHLKEIKIKIIIILIIISTIITTTTAAAKSKWLKKKNRNCVFNLRNLHRFPKISFNLKMIPIILCLFFYLKRKITF